MSFKPILFASTLFLTMLGVSPANAQRDYMDELAESCQQEQTLSQAEISDGYYFTRSRMEGRWCVVIKHRRSPDTYQPGRLMDTQFVRAETKLSDRESVSVTGFYILDTSDSPTFFTLVLAWNFFRILNASITPYGYLEDYKDGNSVVASPYISTIREGLNMVRQYPLPLQSAPF